MKKPTTMYVITFILSFIITNSMMYFIMKNQYDQYKLSLEQETANQTVTVQDTSAIVARDVLSMTLPEKIREDIDEDLPDPEDEYSKLMLLKKRIIALYTEEEYESYTTTQVDSMLTDLVDEIDAIAIRQNKYLKELKDLYFNNKILINERDTLYSEIERLENNIEQIKFDTAQKEEAEQSETDAKSAKYLADTYNKMNSTKVAQLMLALPDSKTIQILKLMNQRKAAKVLEAMPAGKSSMIVKKIARNGK
jgi:flagellar motility protein MotE (MotC chaperone)